MQPHQRTNEARNKAVKNELVKKDPVAIILIMHGEDTDTTNSEHAQACNELADYDIDMVDVPWSAFGGHITTQYYGLFQIHCYDFEAVAYAETILDMNNVTHTTAYKAQHPNYWKTIQ